MASVFTNAAPPRLLSTADVAKLLGLHRNTVYRKISDGSLPAVRLGEDGPLRVVAAELEDWLARHPVVPRGETTDGR
jgi:excisionase family DNA binding protein